MNDHSLTIAQLKKQKQILKYNQIHECRPNIVCVPEGNSLIIF